MKKIFTMILLVAGSTTIATAQFNGQKDIARYDNKKPSGQYEKQTGYGNSIYNDSYYFSLREKQAKLQKIDAFYDQKIMAVKKSWRFNGRQKARQIQMLEGQKKAEIWQAEKQYAKKDDRGGYDRSKDHDGKKW